MKRETKHHRATHQDDSPDRDMEPERVGGPNPSGAANAPGPSFQESPLQGDGQSCKKTLGDRAEMQERVSIDNESPLSNDVAGLNPGGSVREPVVRLKMRFLKRMDAWEMIPILKKTKVNFSQEGQWLYVDLCHSVEVEVLLDWAFALLSIDRYLMQELV